MQACHHPKTLAPRSPIAPRATVPPTGSFWPNHHLILAASLNFKIGFDDHGSLVQFRIGSLRRPLPKRHSLMHFLRALRIRWALSLRAGNPTFKLNANSFLVVIFVRFSPR